MFKKSKAIVAATKGAAERIVTNISDKITATADLNEDGKVNAEDLCLAATRTKSGAKSLVAQAKPLIQAIGKNDLAKDAATGAAIGAIIALPLPIIGSATGAAIGAGIGVFKNLTTKRSISENLTAGSKQFDLHAELLKLEDLRTKGILSDVEFQEQKQAILKKAQA